MDKKKLTETEKENLAKKEREERIIKEERARTAIEKYKIKEIGGWMFLPWLLFLFSLSMVFMIILQMKT